MKADLFELTVPIDATHVLFQRMLHDGHLAARRMMNEIFASFVDADRHFVRDFQTSGFSARVLELALFAYLQEEGLELDRSEVAPDYVIPGTRPVAIEVTTTNPADNQEPTPIEDFVPVPDDLAADDRAFVLQIDKALRKKLGKRDAQGRAYWEKPHVSDVPFVIAVSTFHDDHSQWQSAAQVAQYLYGRRAVVDADGSGRSVMTFESIAEHESEDRTVSSGLFNLPEASQLSAVLFSNSHTAAKFDRIGTENGYGSDRVTVIRFGTCFDPDPEAFDPKPFHYVVGERPRGQRERWAEGLHLFLNPRAARQLHPSALPSLPYWIVENGAIFPRVAGEFHPMTSKTIILNAVG
jgi:hypothetical protein